MDARMQKHRITCWLGRFVAALLLVLFATASPARAAVESVAPVPDGGIWLFWDPSNLSPPTSSPDVACNSGYNAQWMPGNGYVYVGSVPNQYGYASLGYRDCKFLDTRTGTIIGGGGSIQRVPFPPVCPVPTVNPTVPYSYNVTSGMCERTAQVTCPVDPLTQPPFSDACSTSLEAGKGADVNNKCGTLREPDMVKAAACIADKIKALSTPRITYSVPSATIRTTEYQNHLLEIWDKSATLNCLMNSLSYTPEYLAAMRLACAQRKAEIDAEKQSHGLDSPPSPSGNAAPHVEHRAIDVSRNVAKELINQVTIYATKTTIVNGRKIEKRVVVSDVEDYIHSATVNPPACDSNISWGGRFDPIDRVHFQLPK